MNSKKESIFENKRYQEIREELNREEVFVGKNALTKAEIIQKLMPLQNPSLCAECGGSCCKHNGCSYLPMDFQDLSFNGLKTELEKGYISIISQPVFYEKHVKILLYVRTRNEGRPIVDFLTTKRACRLWTPNGCPFSIEDRPSLGIMCIPGYENGNLSCHPIVTDSILETLWYKHQKTLKALVSHFTGKTVQKVMQEQADALIRQIYTKQMSVGMISAEERELVFLMENLKNYGFIV